MALKDRWWEFGLCLLGVILCFWLVVQAFGRVAPWPNALSPERAEAEWPGQIDPSWRAVVGNHGRPQEWPLGTVADNPTGFAAWATALVAGGAGVWYCFRRLGRFT